MHKCKTPGMSRFRPTCISTRLFLLDAAWHTIAFFVNCFGVVTVNIFLVFARELNDVNITGQIE